MDPVGLLFTNVDSADRLDPTDADYVDVIHTDAGGFGVSYNVGHIDFYPNGGSTQPGCQFNIFSKLTVSWYDVLHRVYNGDTCYQLVISS